MPKLSSPQRKNIKRFFFGFLGLPPNHSPLHPASTVQHVSKVDAHKAFPNFQTVQQHRCIDYNQLQHLPFPKKRISARHQFCPWFFIDRPPRKNSSIAKGKQPTKHSVATPTPTPPPTIHPTPPQHRPQHRPHLHVVHLLFHLPVPG